MVLNGTFVDNHHDCLKHVLISMSVSFPCLDWESTQNLVNHSVGKTGTTAVGDTGPRPKMRKDRCGPSGYASFLNSHLVPNMLALCLVSCSDDLFLDTYVNMIPPV